MPPDDQLPPVEIPLPGPLAALEPLVELLRALFSAPPDPPKPSKPLEAPRDKALQTYLGLIDVFLHDWHLPWLVAYPLAGFMGAIVFMGTVLGGLALWLLSTIGVDLAAAVLQLIDQARKDVDPALAELDTVVLNELLGTEFTAPDVPTGTDTAAHLGRAERIGALFLQQIVGELGEANELTPEGGLKAASRWVGLNVNFAVQTALVHILGESFSVGTLDSFRSLGVEVARNLGLGRLTRMFLRPIIQTLADVPITWQLNRQFHPTQFKPNEVVNPFTGAFMDEQTILTTLELEGYDEKKAQQLIKLHRKKLPEADLEILLRWKQFGEDLVRTHLREIGWPEELHDTLIHIHDLRRADARLTSLLDALEKRVEEGHLTTEELKALLDELPLGEAEKEIVLATVAYKQNAPHKAITFAELQAGFDQGLVDLDGFEARLKAQGYSPDDVGILTTLTLLKFGKDQEAADRKKKHATDKAARAEARAVRAARPRKKPPGP